MSAASGVPDLSRRRRTVALVQSRGSRDAAGLLHEAKAHGAWTVESQLAEPTAAAGLVDAAIAMSAEDALPRLHGG